MTGHRPTGCSGNEGFVQSGKPPGERRESGGDELRSIRTRGGVTQAKAPKVKSYRIFKLPGSTAQSAPMSKEALFRVHCSILGSFAQSIDQQNGCISSPDHKGFTRTTSFLYLAAAMQLAVVPKWTGIIEIAAFGSHVRGLAGVQRRATPSQPRSLHFVWSPSIGGAAQRPCIHPTVGGPGQMQVRGALTPPALQSSVCSSPSISLHLGCPVFGWTDVLCPSRVFTVCLETNCGFTYLHDCVCTCSMQNRANIPISN